MHSTMLKQSQRKIHRQFTYKRNGGARQTICYATWCISHNRVSIEYAIMGRQIDLSRL